MHSERQFLVSEVENVGVTRVLRAVFGFLGHSEKQANAQEVFLAPKPLKFHAILRIWPQRGDGVLEKVRAQE